MYINYAVLWTRIAAQQPAAPAIRTGPTTIDYGTFEQQAAAVAAGLKQLGVESGARVGFLLHNTAEYLIAFYACLKLEAIPVSLNYRYRSAEVAELLRVAEPRVLICADVNLAVARDAIESLAREGVGPHAVVTVGKESLPEAQADSDGPVGIRFDDLARTETVALDPPSRDAQLYIFTGGTTGTPKAVVWSLGDLFHTQQGYTYPPVGLPMPTTLEDAVEAALDPVRPSVVTLPLAPFIHATALFSVMSTLSLGGTVVINPDPSLDTTIVAELILTMSVTRLIVAGDAVAQPVLDTLEARLQGSPTTLTSVISSGMRFSDQTKRRFHQLGQVAIVDILASTEGGPFAMATTVHEDELPARFRLTEDAVVLDERQQEIQDRPRATGVLAYRGALPLGYLNDPIKTEQSYPVINGVRHVCPGDYVRVEQDRHIELLGRGSSVVNTGGEKVYPSEVEEALLSHPEVTDAVVFGLPDERWGERVAAVVAVRDSATVTEDALKEHVAKRIAGYKKPRTVAIRGALDRGPTGKLNMRTLRSSLAAPAFDGTQASDGNGRVPLER